MQRFLNIVGCTVIILALGIGLGWGVVTALNHIPAAPVPTKTESEYVDGGVIGIRRYYDDKYGVACYTRSYDSISCVKVTK